MPAVFVHGVPDTSVVWDPVLERARSRRHRRGPAPGLRRAGARRASAAPMDEYAGVDRRPARRARRARRPRRPRLGLDDHAARRLDAARARPDVVACPTAASPTRSRGTTSRSSGRRPRSASRSMELMTPEAVELVMPRCGHPDPAGMAARRRRHDEATRSCASTAPRSTSRRTGRPASSGCGAPRRSCCGVATTRTATPTSRGDRIADAAGAHASTRSTAGTGRSSSTPTRPRASCDALWSRAT